MSASSFSIDDWETTKVVLNIAFWVVTGGVFIGVFLEKDEFADRTKMIGRRILLSCLALETGFAVAIFEVDAQISYRQRDEIAALEKRLLPRHINSAQSREIAEAIASSPPGVKFEFSATTEEAVNLAQSLAAIFEKAGWIWIDWRAKPGDITTWLPVNRHRVGWIVLSGIQISFSNPELFVTASQLMGSLKAAMLEGIRIDAAEAALENKNAPMVIRIMIGERPALHLRH